MITLSQVKRANSQWFSGGNKRFFGDTNYYIYHSKKHNPYLVRRTSAWSDMCGGVKKFSFRINPVNPSTLKIESLLDEVFKTLDAARDYVKTIDDDISE